MQNLKLKTGLIHTNYHRPIIFNCVLWFLVFFILLFVFSKGQLPMAIDFIYTFTFILLLLMTPVLINLYILIPKLLKKEKYIAYGFTFVICLEVFALYGSWAFKYILDWLFPSYFFISYLTREKILLIVVIFLIVTTLIKLAEDWFYFNTQENKNLRFKNQHFQTQLLSLRSQINPHFLFNSLNVIYALALEKKEGITNAIVQLSDILRYVIYDSDTEQVTLKDEITLLQNYIAFQNHRLNTPNIITLNINIENETFKIYPMLLLPLLENSYKHGLDTINMEPIVIDMSQKDANFNFEISNANLNLRNVVNDKHSGVGLENIQNNLNLVYPNNHHFEIIKTEKTFKVSLSITNDN